VNVGPLLIASDNCLEILLFIALNIMHLIDMLLSYSKVLDEIPLRRGNKRKKKVDSRQVIKDLKHRV
jgi:hypothetical protein